MENKDTLRNLLAAAGVFLLVWIIGEKLLLPPVRPPSASEKAPTPSLTSEAPAVNPAASPNAVANPDVKAESAPSPASKVETGQFRLVEADAERTVVIGAGERDGFDRKAPEAPFRMRLTLSNVGASVESATLTDHAQKLHDPSRYELLSLVGDVSRGWFRSLAIEKINVDGTDWPLSEKRWNISESTSEYQLDGESGHRVAAWIEIHGPDGPVLRLTRTFWLPRQTVQSGEHDLRTELTVDNLSAESHRIVVTYRGGVGVRQEHPQHDDRVIDTGIRNADGRVLGSRTLPPAVRKTLKVPLYSPTPANLGTRLSWAASANNYFTCTVAPLSTSKREPADNLTEVAVVDGDGNSATDDDFMLRFVTRGDVVPPARLVTYRSEVYIGEKDGPAFRQHPVYRERDYYFQIAHGFGWCTFNFLVELMIWLLNGIHRFLPNFGLAIIILVLIVRTLLHPITKKGQVNMVRMQKQMGELAPKLEEIKRKFANDKVRLQQETMKLYRDGGVNPAGQFLTCLPMICQMPIWVALWLSLNNNIRMRHEPFFAWIRDLTAPDALYTFASPLNLPLYGPVPAFNLLPFLLALTMYAQQKTQPKPKPSPNMTQQQREQQEMMQKMMPIMSVMMLFLFYGAPSGLTLYITASSLFGMIEQWRIRRHITIHEERRMATSPAEPRPLVPSSDAKPKSALGTWIERLQKKAEEAQRLQKTQRTRPRR